RSRVFLSGGNFLMFTRCSFKKKMAIHIGLAGGGRITETHARAAIHSRAGAHNPAKFPLPRLDVLDYADARGRSVSARSNAEISPRSVCTPEPAREKPHCLDAAMR